MIVYLNKHLVIFLFFSLIFLSPALSDKRVALVIGNSDYQHVPALKNPHNDANEISEMLKGLGFEVLVGLDQNQTEFSQTFAEFSKRLPGADAAVFYYAGHGIQLDGRNHLISTNATLESSFTLYGETIPLDEIIRLMESYSPINIAFLDACRDSPFLEKVQASLPAKRSTAVHRGLAAIKQTKSDTLLMFATSSDEVAEDGEGDHSPFADALLRNLVTPDVAVSQITKRIINDVSEATNFRQKPEVISAMGSEFYFNPSVEKPDDVVLAFEEAKRENSGRVWRKFLTDHPDAIYTTKATEALDNLIDLGKVFDPGVSPKVAEFALDLSQDDKKKIQKVLNDLGYKVGAIDGQIGPATRKQLKKFQSEWHLMPTGHIDATTYSTIFSPAVARAATSTDKIEGDPKGEAAEDGINISQREIKLLELGLEKLGYMRIFGSGSDGITAQIRRAISKYQTDKGYDVSGYLSEFELQELVRAGRSADATRLTKLATSDFGDLSDPRLRALIKHYEDARFAYAYFNDHLYVNVKLPFEGSWDEANDFSKSIGGHLVVFSSAEERKFIDKLISQDLGNFKLKKEEWFEGPGVGYFQKASATRSSDGWTSVTGEPVRQLSWSPSQPSELILRNAFGYAAYGGSLGKAESTWAQRQKNLKFADRARFKQSAIGFVFEFPLSDVKTFPILFENEN